MFEGDLVMTFSTLGVGFVGANKGHPSFLCLHQEPVEGLTQEHRQMETESLLSLFFFFTDKADGESGLGSVSHMGLLGPHP